MSRIIYLTTRTSVTKATLTDPDTLELLEKMQFKSERLGNVMSGAHRMEPILRDADLVSFDASSIRASDHAAHSEAGPNGMTLSQHANLLAMQA